MITLFELRELAREKCLDDPIDLCTLLWVWTERDSGGDLAAVLENTGIDLESMRAALMSIEEGPSEAETEILKELLVSEIDGPVHGGHILEKICECPDNRAIEALEDAGLDCEALLKNVRRHVSNKGTLAAAGIEVAEKKENPLLAYGRDLTAEAEQGEFDALCDRPAELDRMFEVLLRKQKGNVALTGPAGVGKSGLVELFARCVARGDVPQGLGNVRVFEVNMGKLVAGTKYRGDFEERMETVIAAVQDRDPAILFVDEMHMLWGAGRAEGIVTDAANMLKPVLGRGGLRFIGATTSEEYRKYIARDAALARRFQEVRLSEPDDELTEKMVLAQADSLAAHHRIGIHPDVARKAVELTNQHVINRFQPDKSVDLLDSACVRAGRDGRSELNVPDLLHVLSRQTGRPISNLTGDDRATLRNLAASLKRVIVGQDAAIDRIVGLLVHRRQGFVATERPLASMLFCGRTGIGKTETAIRIAEMFFGEKKRLLHLDLAEFNQEMSVNKLIGSPPGYSGSDEEGVLSRFLQTAGSGVILLDEIEKAHPDIHKLLLGILDSGRATTARGERLDARQCVIVMTTNAVKDADFNRKAIGFGKDGSDFDPAELMENHFPAEFLGRLDEIVLFDDLGEREMKKIILLRLDEAFRDLEKRNIRVKFDRKRLSENLLDSLKKNRAGARGVLRLVETRVLQPISMAMLYHEGDGPVCIHLEDSFYETGGVEIRSCGER